MNRAAAAESFAGLAAIFAGALGAFTLTPVASGNPAYLDRPAPTTGWTAFDTTAWNSLQANSIALGAAVAVPVCVLLASAGSRRNAWGVVTACAVVIGVLTAATPDGTGLAATLCYYGRPLVAGIMIGAAVAAAWGRQIPQIALLFGGVGTWLVVWVREVHDSGGTYPRDAPWVLIAAAVVAGVVAAATAQTGFRATRPTVAVARLAIVGAIGYALLNRVLGAVVGDFAGADSTLFWSVAVAVAAILLAAVAALINFASAADARFVLVLVAVTAAATPIANAPVTDTTIVPFAFLAGLLATAIGLRVARRARRPLAGLVVVALVPLITVIRPNFGDDAWVVLLVVLVGLGAGHVVGSNLPDESGFATFGLAIPPASFAISMLYTVPRIPIVRSEQSVGSSSAYATYLDIEWEYTRLPDLLMLAFVAACAGLVFLRSRGSGRPANPHLST